MVRWSLFAVVDASRQQVLASGHHSLEVVAESLLSPLFRKRLPSRSVAFANLDQIPIQIAFQHA